MNIEIEREEDGRWIAEIPNLAGVMTYGQSREEPISKVKALALRVLPCCGLAGLLSANLERLTEFCREMAGQIMSSHFMIKKRSTPVCWHASPSARASHMKISEKPPGAASELYSAALHSGR